MAITQLDAGDSSVAQSIWALFQRAYKVEATLIGARDFPPLRRTVAQVQASQSSFYGLQRNAVLVGVVETERQGQSLDICSLVVEPAYFGQGCGQALMQYVIAREGDLLVKVQTAVLNVPAVKLYQKMGFSEAARYITDSEMALIQLERRPR